MVAFDHKHYVPVLKWRAGEYLALSRLEDDVKSSVTPLFEIPEEKWDFEEKQAAVTLDEHLERFGKRLGAKWGNRRCFVDSCYLAGNRRIATTHHLEWIFSLARDNGCRAVPVVGLSRHDQYKAAVRRIIETDGRGICVRLQRQDFSEPGLRDGLRSLLQYMEIGASSVDLVIDENLLELGSSAADYAALLQSRLGALPAKRKWRTLTVTGSVFPESLPSTKYRPHGTLSRIEWLGYKGLVARLGPEDRIPSFGDYSVSHPRTNKLDPRFMDPNAKVKYTIDDAWLVVMGTRMRQPPYREQYRDLCQRIIRVSPPVYPGKDFSWGDEYIYNCANSVMVKKKVTTTGGSSTWPCVCNNHHITRVVRDLASLYDT